MSNNTTILHLLDSATTPEDLWLIWEEHQYEIRRALSSPSPTPTVDKIQAQPRRDRLVAGENPEQFR